ncbi:MAG: YrdB family protein [Crocinitomicaceae bacterium]|nr:YrdB family protein [Crocinitomicaceae bacterium]
MGSNPINLALRFILEISSLVIIGIWSYKLSDDFSRYIWMILIPVFWATIWGVFNVPNDPSRSGKAPVIVPGYLRLIIEILFFGFGCWVLYNMEQFNWCILLISVVSIHYVISYDRIRWLLSK